MPRKLLLFLLLVLLVNSPVKSQSKTRLIQVTVSQDWDTSALYLNTTVEEQIKQTEKQSYSRYQNVLISRIQDKLNNIPDSISKTSLIKTLDETLSSKSLKISK